MGSQEFPRINFFWCSSGNWIFASLPAVQTKMKDSFDKMATYFTGEFDRVLIQGTGPERVIDAEEGLVLPPKPVTELDRLAYVVNQIENDC